jgi:hypothetical protein
VPWTWWYDQSIYEAHFTKTFYFQKHAKINLNKTQQYRVFFRIVFKVEVNLWISEPRWTQIKFETNPKMQWEVWIYSRESDWVEEYQQSSTLC